MMVSPPPPAPPARLLFLNSFLPLLVPSLTLSFSSHVIYSCSLLFLLFLFPLVSTFFSSYFPFLHFFRLLHPLSLLPCSIFLTSLLLYLSTRLFFHSSLFCLLSNIHTLLSFIILTSHTFLTFSAFPPSLCFSIPS